MPPSIYPIESIGSDANLVTFSREGLMYLEINEQERSIEEERQFTDETSRSLIRGSMLPVVTVSGIILPEESPTALEAIRVLTTNLQQMVGSTQRVTFVPQYGAPPAEYNILSLNKKWGNFLENYKLAQALTWQLRMRFSNEINDDEEVISDGIVS